MIQTKNMRVIQGQDHESEFIHSKLHVDDNDDDDETVPTLEPSSDLSNTSIISGDCGGYGKLHHWLHDDAEPVTNTCTSRSSSHAVTHARTTIPKPLLPIKAVRAMNCVHSKTQHQIIPATEQALQTAVVKPSSLKRSSTSNSEQKKVRFGDLQMRNYEIVLGDHPDCSSGPPVSPLCFCLY
jgi:hypothetical protein